ncbi:MAG: hypothetical protein CVU13_12280 [Bacteroidetes bacterium HGW-Bacteroidetes-8]|jgi:NitT/TauT family transport system substrate-binding protein|nr:MAG: hypothetical protein CVU13_12280 [Bacteroidetes bacterium HGW-Bacteroidetes-8]
MHKFLLLVFAAILSLAGCKQGSKTGGGDSEIVIATLKGPSSMGMIKFIDSISLSAGSPIRIEILNEPMQVRKLMLDGTAHFAILPTTMAALMYNKSVDFRLIAIPVWGSLYLLGDDSAITSWKELRGKRINVMGRGMTPDLLFRYLLQINGIDPDTDVTLDYSFPTHIDLSNAVAAGQVKLGVLSEPLATLVLDKNRGVKTIFDLNAEWEKLQGVAIAQTAFVGRESFMRNNPGVVEQIVSAYRGSSSWVNQNPDSAAVLIVKHGIMPNFALALQSIGRSNIRFVSAADVRDGINSYLKVFYDINPEIIGGKMADENFIY